MHTSTHPALCRATWHLPSSAALARATDTHPSIWSLADAPLSFFFRRLGVRCFFCGSAVVLTDWLPVPAQIKAVDPRNSFRPPVHLQEGVACRTTDGERAFVQRRVSGCRCRRGRGGECCSGNLGCRERQALGGPAGIRRDVLSVQRDCCNPFDFVVHAMRKVDPACGGGVGGMVAVKWWR